MPMVRALAVTDNRLTEEFDQLFREHSQLVYRTAFGVTGNAEDAEDVLQTIFLRLLRRDLRARGETVRKLDRSKFGPEFPAC